MCCRINLLTEATTAERQALQGRARALRKSHSLCLRLTEGRGPEGHGSVMTTCSTPCMLRKCKQTRRKGAGQQKLSKQQTVDEVGVIVPARIRRGRIALGFSCLYIWALVAATFVFPSLWLSVFGFHVCCQTLARVYQSQGSTCSGLALQVSSFLCGSGLTARVTSVVDWLPAALAHVGVFRRREFGHTVPALT